MLRLALLLSLFFTTAYAAAPLSLSSTAFITDASIPTKYTCDGQNISPPLAWSNTPANTKSFAIIVSDPDAPGGTFYHWLLYNIPTTQSNLSEGANLPAGAALGKNSFGKVQYNGPCPPRGEKHHYQFTLYALDSFLQIPVNSNASMLLAAMGNHVLAKAELTSLYQH